MAIKSKTRKQGNSIMITIPAVMNVEEGKEFIIYKKENGSIVLVPRIDDYFATAKDGEYHETLEWEDIYVPQGNEVVE